jgi:hypothetical protein
VDWSAIKDLATYAIHGNGVGQETRCLNLRPDVPARLTHKFDQKYCRRPDSFCVVLTKLAGRGFFVMKQHSLQEHPVSANHSLLRLSIREASMHIAISTWRLIQATREYRPHFN